MAGDKPRVFVSYAHADPAEEALADAIAARLREHGATVFIDQGLKLGQDWNAEIERHLAAFCVLLSAASVASPMVQNEIAWVGGRLRREGRPEVWPIRCNHGGQLPYDIGSLLRRVQYFTWKGEADTASVLDQLLDRLRELRDGPADEPPPPSLCTLPGRLGDFTGREQELDELCRALTAGDRRATVSAIGGLGGVGKNTLALEAAWVDPDAPGVEPARAAAGRPSARKNRSQRKSLKNRSVPFDRSPFIPSDLVAMQAGFASRLSLGDDAGEGGRGVLARCAARRLEARRGHPPA